MSRLFAPGDSMILRTANRYPSSNSEAVEMSLSDSRNKEMRAMTIATFRVSQNTHQLSEVPMSSQVLRFLCGNSLTANNYWKSIGHLVEVGDRLALSPPGLAECQNTLLGRSGAYSTTEDKVSEWVQHMLLGT